jgi:hypothetical protein
METKVIGPFFFEEPAMIVYTFLAMMENTALCHFSVGTVFRSAGAPLHFFRRVRPFLDREFPDHWLGRGEPIPWPLLSTALIPLDIFCWGL